jgi:invasion protein IalB
MRNVLLRFGAAATFVLTSCVATKAEVPAQAAKQRAETATREVVGDWIVACSSPKTGHKTCVMSQTLASKKLKQPVSVLLIGKDRTGKLKGSLRMPVGVSLQEGVVIRIEHQDPFTVPFATCHRIGCFAPFDLSEPLVGKLKTASNITVVAHSVSQQALSFNFSTRGFSNAYETYMAQAK